MPNAQCPIPNAQCLMPNAQCLIPNKMKRITINTASPDQARASILILYTGGTFGMTYDAQGVLIPFDFSLILHHLPTLKNLALELTVISFDKPIDSSNIQPAHWQALAALIFDHYDTH